MPQTTVTTHSDGIPVVETQNVTSPYLSETSQAQSPSDEFYRSKFSTLAKNRAYDGSELNLRSVCLQSGADISFLPVRAVLHLEQRPGVISLLAGKPHAATYPFTSLGFSVRDPIDPSKEVPVQLTAEELEFGLQYSPTVGIPSLIEWIYGLQEIAHGRKREDGWKISVGNGSHDLMYKVASNPCLPRPCLLTSPAQAVTSLVNPGDVVLVETPTYA